MAKDFSPQIDTDTADAITLQTAHIRALLHAIDETVGNSGPGPSLVAITNEHLDRVDAICSGKSSISISLKA